MKNFVTPIRPTKLSMACGQGTRNSKRVARINLTLTVFKGKSDDSTGEGINYAGLLAARKPFFSYFIPSYGIDIFKSFHRKCPITYELTENSTDWGDVSSNGNATGNLGRVSKGRNG